MWELLFMYGLPSAATTAWLARKLKKPGLMRTQLDEARDTADEARKHAAASEQGRRDALEYARRVAAETREKVNLSLDLTNVAIGVTDIDGNVRQILDLLSEQGVTAKQVAQMQEMLHVARGMDSLREELREALSGRVLSEEEIGLLRQFVAGLAAEDGNGGGRHRQQPETGAQLFVVGGHGEPEEKSA